MSPVNRAGSVSEISPRHSFLRKFRLGLYEKPRLPSYGDLGRYDNWDEINRYEHSSRDGRDETF